MKNKEEKDVYIRELIHAGATYKEASAFFKSVEEIKPNETKNEPSPKQENIKYELIDIDPDVEYYWFTK